MERPRADIQPAQDEFDHELSQPQADGIALADELLKLKEGNSPLTFVDIVLEGNKNDLLAEIENGPIAQLLAAPDQQLAMPSDGSYYPILDVRKENGRLIGIGLRVWGWDDEKWRYIDNNEKPPYNIRKYPGEIDKTRQLEIAMSYRVGRETVTEELSLHFGTAGYIRASSQLHMAAYAETGYEGHGGKGTSNLDDEAVYWFLDFIAKHVGDEPKSVFMLQQERINKIRDTAERNGMLSAIDDLVEGTWEAQALYIMHRPCKLLDGKSILQCIESPESAEKVKETVREILRHWKSADGKWGECFATKPKDDE